MWTAIKAWFLSWFVRQSFDDVVRKVVETLREQKKSGAVDIVDDDKADGQRLDVYMPSERKVFYYFDGGDDVRAADPMVLYRRFMGEKADLITDWKIADSQHKDAPKFAEAVDARIRGIFGLKKFEEGGLTEPEARDLLDQFLDYCSDVKKNTPQTTTSAGATSADTFNSMPRSAPADPPTPATSDSGSTEGGASTDTPAPSPKA